MGSQIANSPCLVEKGVSRLLVGRNMLVHLKSRKRPDDVSARREAEYSTVGVESPTALTLMEDC